MKKDNKKALYESIMASVAKEVKKALNESSIEMDELKIELESLLRRIPGNKLRFDKPLLLKVTYTDVINISKYGEMQDAKDPEISQNIFDWFEGEYFWGDDATEEELMEDIQNVVNILRHRLRK